MALTTEDVKALCAPFPLEAHEWRKGRNDRDYVYITEGGVVARLNEVDPSWSLVVTDRVEREYTTERKTKDGKVYALSAHELAITVCLTVKDVSRYGIGMAEIAPDAAEADKSAVTDALKRAARLFGVGGYLLNDPPGKSAFPQWLRQQSQSIGGAATAASVSQEPEPETGDLNRPPMSFVAECDALRARGDAPDKASLWLMLTGRDIYLRLNDAQTTTLKNLKALSEQAIKTTASAALTSSTGWSEIIPLMRPVKVSYSLDAGTDKRGVVIDLTSVAKV